MRVVDEQEIAERYFARFGPGAPEQARLRAEALASLRDEAGSSMWREIGRRAEQLCSREVRCGERTVELRSVADQLSA